MKKIYSILVSVLIMSFTLSSCLDTDSDQILLPDDLELDSPSTNFYSINGILSELERLSLRYVVLGELRGDLMETTSYSDSELQEVYNFDISPDNKFNQVSDYYSIINLCNYMVAKVDTAIEMKGEKINLRDYVAAKGIRAWTYMQVALNYGEAKYYTDPILDVSDAYNSYPSYSIEELAPVLIEDLVAWKDIQTPEDYNSQMFFPVRMLLGDMYLWLGQYENAAKEYYGLIDDELYIIHWNLTNEYVTQGDQVTGGIYVNWDNLFDVTSTNIISVLVGSNEYNEDGSPLDSLMFQVQPSDVAINNWENQVYYVTNESTVVGDLRGEVGTFGSYTTMNYSSILNNDYPIEKGRIVKFEYSDETERILIASRAAHLYLRYAEAVNRLGKPNLAFAVLKNGLGPVTLANDNLVPPQEKYSNPESETLWGYIDFSDERYMTTVTENSITRTIQRNIGIHGRGCGNVNLATDYGIPDLGVDATLEDSMVYVEDMIIEELALETAFEGNRFHDLMRVAKRRGDNAYLADKVAEKYDDSEAIRSKLMDETNWYLPTK